MQQQQLIEKLFIPNGWKVVPLSSIANVVPSNVDKKIKSNEIPVLLCNYMDVYAHDYLNKSINFSQGSVTSIEFQKFKLKKGDVIITKDSETPNDIAVPAVVTEELENVVCGYHLALLRPNPNEVDGRFLSKALQTMFSRRHFGNSANGATRYGLTLKAISSCPILLPPLEEQEKVVDIIMQIDQAIDNIHSLLNKYESIKTGLLQDLLTGKVRVDLSIIPNDTE